MDCSGGIVTEIKRYWMRYLPAPKNGTNTNTFIRPEEGQWKVCKEASKD